MVRQIDEVQMMMKRQHDYLVAKMRNVFSTLLCARENGEKKNTNNTTATAMLRVPRFLHDEGGFLVRYQVILLDDSFYLRLSAIT